MTEKKYTRKQFIIDMLNKELTAEQRECAEKWLAALSKKANAPRVNKTRVANEQLAAAAIKTMAAHTDALINATWLCAHVAGITSAQKATAVMAVAIEAGKVIRYEEKRSVYYRLA